MTILLFLLVLFVLILVHEWGHFIVAKKTGMRVDEFGIGFPPKLFGVKKGETEYTLNSLPIGGFVRIWGENYEDVAMAEEGIDRSRAFSSRPKWAQALVLVAGVTMNVLLAWFLFTLAFAIGVPTAVEESVASDSAELFVSEVLPGSPASDLPAGSIITSVRSGDVVVDSPTPTEFSNVVTGAGESSVDVSYRYGEEESVLTLTPQAGLIEDDPERRIVGASLSLIEQQSRPFGTAIIDGFTATWKGLAGILSGLWSLLSQSVTGDADFSQVAGPVGIVGMVGDAAAFGLTSLLTFTAIISLNLAVINLLPFPALDGGRLVFVAIESVTRRPIPPQWAGRLNLVGFALLMILMVVVTYNDIARIL